MPDRELPVGTSLFGGLALKHGAKAALGNMRDLLKEMQWPVAAVMRTHDIRRGHERDLMNRGGSLCDLRAAAEWSAQSTSFTSYLDLDEVEDKAVHEVHDVSSSESSESSM